MRFSLLAAAHVLGDRGEWLGEAIDGYGVGYQILDDAKNFRPDLIGHKAFEDLRHGLKNWICLELFATWSDADLALARASYGTPALERRFLDDQWLCSAWSASVDEAARLIDGAVRDLSRFGEGEYLRLLLMRPLDDLRERIADGD
jgi:hypothetical protein